MPSPIDEYRATALLALARRIVFVVGLIAIGAVVDVIPEKIAELSLGIGICLMLASAVAPIEFLNRLSHAGLYGASRPTDA